VNYYSTTHWFTCQTVVNEEDENEWEEKDNEMKRKKICITTKFERKRRRLLGY
jgi:hypothetical protein